MSSVRLPADVREDRRADSAGLARERAPRGRRSLASHRRVTPSSPLVATSEPSGLNAPPSICDECWPWSGRSEPSSRFASIPWPAPGRVREQEASDDRATGRCRTTPRRGPRSSTPGRSSLGVVSSGPQMPSWIVPGCIQERAGVARDARHHRCERPCRRRTSCMSRSHMPGRDAQGAQGARPGRGVVDRRSTGRPRLSRPIVLRSGAKAKPPPPLG